MPFPNEHAARVINPNRFDEKSFRRKKITDGVDAIMGKLKDEKTMTVQSYRFDKTKFTVEQARKWLKDHDIKVILFEKAIEESATLIEQFKELADQYACLKTGEKSKLKSEEIAIEEAVKLVNHIVELNEITFNVKKMKASSVDLLKEALKKIAKEGVTLEAPLGEMIYAGKNNKIVKEGARDDALLKFSTLVSGKLAFGFIRCYEAEEVKLRENENDKEHRKLFAYKIREFIEFDRPRVVKTERKYARSARVFEATGLPKDWDVSKLSSEQIMHLHASVHDEARRFSLDTEKSPYAALVNRHSLIASEVMSRNGTIGHPDVCELDRMSTKDKSKLIRLSDVLNHLQSFSIPMLSFEGDACLSGCAESVKINVNLPEYDEYMLNIIRTQIKASMPVEIRDRVHVVADKNGDMTHLVPFARLWLMKTYTEERAL